MSINLSINHPLTLLAAIRSQAPRRSTTWPSQARRETAHFDSGRLPEDGSVSKVQVVLEAGSQYSIRITKYRFRVHAPGDKSPMAQNGGRDRTMARL